MPPVIKYVWQRLQSPKNMATCDLSKYGIINNLKVVALGTSLLLCKDYDDGGLKMVDICSVLKVI